MKQTAYVQGRIDALNEALLRIDKAYAGSSPHDASVQEAEDILSGMVERDVAAIREDALQATAQRCVRCGRVAEP